MKSLSLTCAIAAMLCMPAVAEENKTAYLGVMVRSLDSASAADMNLQKGAGLKVAYVAPGSPAEGQINKGDVLTHIDGNLLVNRAQLNTMIRAKAPGDSVALDVVSDSGAEKVTVTLAEHERKSFAGSKMMQLGALEGAAPFVFMSSTNGACIDKDKIQAHIQSFVGGLDGNGGSISVQIEDMLKNMNLQDMAVNANGVFSSMDISAAAVSSLTNSEDGSVLTYTTSNDSHHVKIVGKDGEVIFDGPIDTDEQLDAVPDDYLDDLETLMQLDVKNLSSEGIKKSFKFNMNTK